MEIDQLRQLFEGIRDENRRYANTATRIGNAFLALLSYVGSFSSDKYLRKDIPDFTNFLVKFFAGAEFGEFIDSMLAGKGTGITADGRIQTDRLEVRGSMTVMDLIINQLQGMDADYSFTEIGKIAQVDDLGEKTYKLWIEKRTDYDFVKLQEGDVCYSIVNTLYQGGTDYFTSWMRVLTVNMTDNATDRGALSRRRSSRRPELCPDSGIQPHKEG